MGREGEWPGQQYQQRPPQPAGYAPQSMQSYPGAAGGPYAQGMAQMQPGMRGPPPAGPPSSLYGNTAAPFRPPGPPPGSAPPGVRPQWGALPSGVTPRPSPGSGPPGQPPNGGAPGQIALANRTYGDPSPSPTGSPVTMRPQTPPFTNPPSNSGRPKMGPPPGQWLMHMSV